MAFKDAPSAAIVAVRDLARARRFYEEALGLAPELEGDAVVTFRTGPTQLTIYVSDQAGSNRANAVVWGLGSTFDAVVAELRGKGVVFEEYPDLGMEVVDGIHRQGEFKAAWFKDPDGNILHINSIA